MKRVLLIAVLLGGCEGVPATTTEASAVTSEQIAGTWQAGRATLALANVDRPAYTYIAPNGAIVGPGEWSVEGNTLRRGGFPDAQIVLSGDTMMVTTPGEGSPFPTGTVEMFQRVATYCVPTNAMQSCR